MVRTIAGVVLYSCVLITRLAAADRIDLCVLYSGDPGSEREADFQSFLKQHFTSVILAKDTTFDEKQAQKADVVIFDWSSVYDPTSGPDSEKFARLRKTLPSLSEDYARPTILIGNRGGLIGRHLKLKINHLCNCLDGPAHNLAFNHPLFHTPLEVNPEIEEMPTRDDYPSETIERSLGPTMKVWHVQTKNYPEIDPGLVSDLYGFTDSPDAEVIAQGISQKGPDTLALGRHANFFLWGFYASPSDMTPSAQRLFVNAVAYMRSFDGARPLVRKASSFALSREWALRFALWPTNLTPEARAPRHKLYRANFEKFYKGHPERLPKDAEKDPQAYIDKRLKELETLEDSLMAEYHPEALRKQFGMDAEKYWAYYTENLEYLYSQPDATGERHTPFLVDQDAKALGTSNRRVASLDKWISLLEQGKDQALALRLLARYTQKDFNTPQKWRAWFKQNQPYLFFSDIGGFKFFVAPVATNADASSSR